MARFWMRSGTHGGPNAAKLSAKMVDESSRIHAYIETSRDQYVDVFRQCIVAAREELGALEVEILRPGGAVRDDIVAFAAGRTKIRVVIPSEVPDWTPAIARLDGLTLRVEALEWWDCAIRVTPAPDDETPLEEWLERWQAHEDPAMAPLRGAVHDLRIELDDDETVLLVVDFGTAPAHAFHELIEILAGLGVREATIRCTHALET